MVVKSVARGLVQAWGLALILGFGVLACEDASPSSSTGEARVETECRGDADCEVGRRCTAGRCVPCTERGWARK